MLYHNVSFRIHWQLEKIHTCPTSVAPMDFGGRSLPGILIATWVASYRLIHMQVGWAGEGGVFNGGLVGSNWDSFARMLWRPEKLSKNQRKV